MNLKMKALVLSAVAALAVSGTASATLNTTKNQNGDVLLTVIDEGAVGSSYNPVSVTFDLGSSATLLNSFTVPQTWDVTGATSGATTSSAFQSAWASFTSQDANWAANSIWAVSAVADTTSSAAAGFYTTVASANSGTLSTNGSTPSGNFDKIVIGYAAAVGALPTGTTSLTGTAYYAPSGDAANFSVAQGYGSQGFMAGTQVQGADNIGTSMSVEKLVKGTTANPTGVTNLLVGSQFTFNSNGVLTLAAVSAVPEADTWAMMLAGFGIVGFVAGRRKSNSFKFA